MSFSRNLSQMPFLAGQIFVSGKQILTFPAFVYLCLDNEGKNVV
jgi:hypothetical protein